MMPADTIGERRVGEAIGERPKPGWWFAVSCALVLALSAFVQFSVVERSEVSVPLRRDAGLYFSYAYNLHRFGVYSSELPWARTKPWEAPVPDAITTPGYPLFLLAVPDIEPDPAYLARVARTQAFLGVLSVGLVMLIARRFLGQGATLASGVLTAISPHLAVASAYILTESLFTFLLLLSTWASAWACASKDWRRFAVAGLAWGLCSLTRATTQFIPLVFVVVALAAPGLRAWRKPAFAMLLAFLVVESPWVFRNRVTELNPNQPSLIVSFLHHGSYPGLMYQNRPESFGIPYQFDPGNAAASASVSAALQDIAGKFREEPVKYLRWYLIGKPVALFSWSISGGVGDLYTYPMDRTPFYDEGVFIGLRAIALTLHWPLMALGMFGAISVFFWPGILGLSGDRLWVARVVAGVVLYATAFHMIGAPFSRYGVPFRPVMYLLAVAVAAGLLARRGRQA